MMSEPRLIHGPFFTMVGKHTMSISTRVHYTMLRDHPTLKLVMGGEIDDCVLTFTREKSRFLKMPIMYLDLEGEHSRMKFSTGSDDLAQYVGKYKGNRIDITIVMDQQTLKYRGALMKAGGFSMSW